MLGILYLIICISTGFVLCSNLLPKLSSITKKSFEGQDIALAKGFVLFPAWFLTGTLVISWATYSFAYCFQSKASPLVYGNAFSMGIGFVFSCLGIYSFVRKKAWDLPQEKTKKSKKNKKTSWTSRIFSRFPITIGEIVFLSCVIYLVCKLMWWTFSIKEGTLSVGLSVFSDFAPHLGMIRSFSHGNNFPTMYSHYTGEDIRYHFLFQFLAGNLEFLGLRLDFAFNLPSALSLLSVFALLYVLAVKLSGKRAVGYLTGLLFAFRCSPSFFTFLSKLPKGQSIWEALRENIEFIGYTTNENWGLWNLNVYCNQRHLAFGMGILLLVLLLFMPKLFEMEQRLFLRDNKHRFHAWWKESLFSLAGWKGKDYKTPIVLGTLLGLSAFWNGATLLATIMVLFFFAMVSDRRLEYLITACITAFLSLLQNKFFMEGFAVSGAKLQFGFISENTSFFGTLDYIKRLTGILFLVLMVSFVFAKGVKKWILFAFSVPFFFSFFVSLTSDVTVNHKYIMISIMLMNLFVAELFVNMFSKKNVWLKTLVVGLVFVMTITGYYDYQTVIRRNRPEYNLNFSMEDPLIDWIDENTDSKDIFLTPFYALSRPVLGGAMLFEGHGYYPMTAGYDTNRRYALTRMMYEAESVETLKELIEQNHIDYIIVDSDARSTGEFEINEAVIDAAYEAVYKEGEDYWMLTIYDTSKPRT